MHGRMSHDAVDGSPVSHILPAFFVQTRSQKQKPPPFLTRVFFE
ncbi:hypothetical protein AI2623V1_0603 [Klebsiella oxytoca]|nr:hypothetical protein AI2623V1_0603 [Klebsiella oxytoca]CAF2840023.1 hypothetical protein AI2945V1_0589 [Klebsiella oxytoca]CAH4967987.1 hypothetical protein AI2623V1_0603 [Klebsiella oxytoca]CAH5504765.1 hypothetical protein AI2945V1_0589 [Klebsiella oxytoca]SAQ36223.1 Uncharacterised protein [Klebsiella oxytoca]